MLCFMRWLIGLSCTGSNRKLPGVLGCAKSNARVATHFHVDKTTSNSIRGKIWSRFTAVAVLWRITSLKKLSKPLAPHLSLELMASALTLIRIWRKHLAFPRLQSGYFLALMHTKTQKIIFIEISACVFKSRFWSSESDAKYWTIIGWFWFGL